MSSANEMRVIAKPRHSSIEWQALRHRDSDGRAVFGASEVPTIMGVSKYEQIGDLFLRKIAEPVETEPSPAMVSGNLIEPVLIAEAGNRLGIDVVTPDFMFGRGRLIATPDGIDAVTVARLQAGEIVAPDVWVEAKCTSRYRVKSLADIPEMWRWQMAAQSYITGSTVYLVVLDADLHITVLEVPRNEAAEQSLVDAADAIGACIDRGEMPEQYVAELSAQQVAALWPATDRSVELPDGATDWLFQLEDAQQLRKQAESLEAAAKDWLAQQLRDATVGTIDGQTVVTWREQAGRSSIDTKRLSEDHPQIAEQYTKQGAPFRTMRISRKK